MSTVRQRNVPAQQQKEALMAQADIKAREEEQQMLAAGQKFVPPPFTIKQLLDAIPAHCYQRSAIKSSQYIVQDFVAIGVLAWASFQVDPLLSSFNLPPVAYQLARAAAHTAITLFLGFFGTGLWIIAHECGHQAFSESKTINNSVGWVLHSALLVPYHSWRISHGRHHAATGHITRDEVFVPRSRSQLGVPEIKEEAEHEGISISKQRQEELQDAIGDAPIVVLGHLLIQQLFGWPAYLIRNASGQKWYPPYTNHFQPSSTIFKPDHWSQIIMSDVGLAITFAVLAFWASQRGFREVLTLYVIPYLIVNSDLVAITYLQHTDPLVPHYSAKEWTFARGALTTVDRKFLGPLGKHVLHGICETHVAHHVSSKIPHYSAWEATAALKEFIGEHYQYRDTNIAMDLFRHFRACRFVEDSGDVLFYKNARGVAAAYALPEDVYQADSGVDISADKKKQEKTIASI